MTDLNSMEEPTAKYGIDMHRPTPCALTCPDCALQLPQPSGDARLLGMQLHVVANVDTLRPAHQAHHPVAAGQGVVRVQGVQFPMHREVFRCL